MTPEEAREIVLVGFAKLNKTQRTAMRQFLKQAQPRLDFNYPDGVPDKPPEETTIITPA